MADKIQIRRDTAANWATQNPVLSQGELGAETDTSKIKMGDASSTWNQLGYLIDTGSYATSTQLQTAVSDLVDSAPGALDTLNELAAALGDDANFSTTVTNAIATKATTSTLSAVATSGDYTDLSNRPTIPTALTDVGVTDGSNGQVLSTDGSGTFTFVDSYDDADVSSYLSNNGYGTSSSIVASIVDSAPGALDTLNELASALGDDANFSTTVTNSLALKANTADLNAVATSGAYTDLSGTPTIPSDLTDVGITDGTIGQVLTTNGSGTFTFADAAGGGGGSFEAVASGTLANGDTVIVNSDGTVSVGSESPVPTPNTTSIGPASTIHTQSYVSVNGAVLTSLIGTDKFVFTYGDSNNGGYDTFVVGTISGNNISFGTPVVFQSSYWTVGIDIVAISSTQIVVSHTSGVSRNAADEAQLSIGTVSGSSITFSSPTTVPQTGSTAHPSIDRSGFPVGKMSIMYDPGENKLIHLFNHSSLPGYNNSQGHLYPLSATVCTVNGSSFTFGSFTNILAGVQPIDGTVRSVYDTTSAKTIVSFAEQQSDSTTDAKAKFLTISGTTVSESSGFTAFEDTGGSPVMIALADDKVVLGTRLSSENYNGYLKVGTISGNSITFGGNTDNVRIADEDSNFSGDIQAFPALTYDSNLDRVLAFYKQSGEQGRIAALTISGTDITFDNSVQVLTGSSGAFSQLVWNSNTGKALLAYSDQSTTPHAAKIVTVTASESTLVSNVNAENYVGISDGAYSNGATATIQTAGAVDDAQSGLIAGQAYYVQGDGTLSTTADDPSVFAGTAISATQLMIGKSPEIVSYSDSDVSSYLSSNDYATATATIASITDSAPATLDTLNELAAALGDDANFSTTVTNSIALKANSADLNAVATSGAYADLSGTPSLSAVATSGAYADVSGTPSIPSALTDIGITDGTNGQVLTTNGSGAFTFADAASPYGDSNVASYLASAVIDGGSA